MNTVTVPVVKDEHSQTPIPTAWRRTLFEIVDALREGDFGLSRGIAGVRPAPPNVATNIAQNIAAYGARLLPLPEESWQTSACQWMRSYWEVLVDLFTQEEGASDLALGVRVYESNATYIFEVQGVHVP